MRVFLASLILHGDSKLPEAELNVKPISHRPTRRDVGRQSLDVASRFIQFHLVTSDSVAWALGDPLGLLMNHCV